MAGAGNLVASTLQGIVMLGVIAGVYWVWSGNATAASRGAILILGILLFTRYAFIYDYAILAIPLAWLWQHGQTTGWLSLEKPLLLCGWVMPLVEQFDVGQCTLAPKCTYATDDHCALYPGLEKALL